MLAASGNLQESKVSEGAEYSQKTAALGTVLASSDVVITVRLDITEPTAVSKSPGSVTGQVV